MSDGDATFFIGIFAGFCGYFVRGPVGVCVAIAGILVAVVGLSLLGDEWLEKMEKMGARA